MTNVLPDQLYQVTLDAFEHLAAMTPLPAEETTPPGSVASRSAFIDFRGSWVGRFRIQFHGGLAQAVAKTMLDVTPSAAQEDDALKEMANVICGNLLPYIAGPKPEFQIAPPQIETTPASV